jgi:hypothetical protein
MKNTAEDYTKYKGYIMEFLPLLKEDALAAKAKYYEDKTKAFYAGYYSAYYKTMALIMEVTEGLDVESTEWVRAVEDQLMDKSDLKYKEYLIVLGPLLKEHALKAKTRCHQDRNNKFYSGYYTAFHGIMTLVMLLTIGFDMDLKELGLHDIDPDRDLVE